MFTGIVQGTGKIVHIHQPSADFRSHTVALPEHMAHNLQIGASVAHNGCCLTITRINGNQATFDLMAETLAKTNLGSLKNIGGHPMSGHIIATTPISRIEQNAHNRTLYFRLPPQLAAYILPKGFIGLDGCSLTIGDVTAHEFSVHLIPETLQRTLFGSRQVGDSINIEIDAQTQAIVDTVERVLAQRKAA